LCSSVLSSLAIGNGNPYLNEYLMWYNTKRIKTSLGNMSLWEYRQSLGLVA
ncbi:IS3 family transposase, partial [Eubacterium sp. An11]|uniref:IS3 family transposase n=1 Tax=Eubacterium sp. An11 TaxID=1965542 RepID=UPI00111DD721